MSTAIGGVCRISPAESLGDHVLTSRGVVHHVVVLLMGHRGDGSLCC